MEMSFDVEALGQLTLMVVFHTAATPPLADWERYESRAREEKQRAGKDFQRIRTLVVSDGGAPNTKQRHSLQNEIWEGRAMKLALLSNALKNPIKRGIASALAWMNPAFKICAPYDLHGALAHLDLLHELERTWEICARLQARMPQLGTLEGIADALKRPRLRASGGPAVRTA